MSEWDGMSDNGEQSLRARLSGLFDDDAPRTLAVRVFNIALATLIIVNVAAVILESVSWMSQRYSLTFLTIERVATRDLCGRIFFARLDPPSIIAAGVSAIRSGAAWNICVASFR